MENTYTNNLLVNVCQRGIASGEDFSVCEQLLSAYLPEYCIMVVKIKPEHSTSIAFVDAETKFLTLTSAMAVRPNPSENVYIAGISHERSQDFLCETALNYFGECGFIGISCSFSGVRFLHEGYQQAYSLTGMCTEEKKCLVYDEAQAKESKFCLDISSLLKLQDYIHAADSEQVHIFFDTLEENSKELIGTELFHIFFVLRQMLLRVGSDMHSTPADDTPMSFTYDENAHDCFERLRFKALSIVEQARNHKSEKTDQITNAIFSMIENDFCDENMSADYLADKLNCSAKHIYQKVKERTGKPLGDIIEEHRLNYAKELLISTDKKNEEIAHLCGYTTLNTFYRVFRKHHSISPGEWRKSNSPVR